MSREKDIEYLKKLIERGEFLIKEGFPAQGMNEMNKLLLERLEAENEIMRD